MKTDKNEKPKEFRLRLDFYWEYITVYFVAMIVYACLVGSMNADKITIKMLDPVVILICGFILMSSCFLLYNFLKKKTIIVGRNFITFRTRHKEKIYSLGDIRKIRIGKRKNIRIPVSISTVHIYLVNRKFPVLFKPASYWNEKELVALVFKLKQLVDLNNKGKLNNLSNKKKKSGE